MAVLIDDQFSERPNGLLGEPWSLTGTNQLRCASGFVVLPDGGTNGYASTRLIKRPKTVDGYWVFLPGGLPNICLISHDQDAFNGSDMGMHLVIGHQDIAGTVYSVLAFQVRENNGPFINLPDLEAPTQPVVTYLTELPRSQLLGVHVEFQGDTAYVTAPNGQEMRFQHEYIAKHSGSALAIQIGPQAVAAPIVRSWWYRVYADGQLLWKLVPPVTVDKMPIGAGSLTVSRRRPMTVFGDDQELHLCDDGNVLSGGTEQGGIPEDAKYVWYGGHVNTTDDEAIKDLWEAHGFTAEVLD